MVTVTVASDPRQTSATRQWKSLLSLVGIVEGRSLLDQTISISAKCFPRYGLCFLEVKNDSWLVRTDSVCPSAGVTAAGVHFGMQFAAMHFADWLDCTGPGRCWTHGDFIANTRSKGYTVYEFIIEKFKKVNVKTDKCVGLSPSFNIAIKSRWL